MRRIQQNPQTRRTSLMPTSGVLNLNKPSGITSRKVVDQVQRLVRPAKVGHAGTLDPLARGVLVVCVGTATRLIEYVQRMPKQYTGTFLLGRSSPTEDTEGEVTELEKPPVPTLEAIVAAAAALTGRIRQRPPAFSALKVGGRRAYDLARQGRQVDLEPRNVTVYALAVEAYDYPRLTLRIECGAGTYVRSLGRDLAESLSTAAVMSGLVRTAVGGFHIEDAVEPQLLSPDGWMQYLRPPVAAAEGLPRVDLSPEEAARVRQGQTIEKVARERDAEELAALDADGRLVAILAPRGAGRLGPTRTFPPE